MVSRHVRKWNKWQPIHLASMNHEKQVETTHCGVAPGFLSVGCQPLECSLNFEFDVFGRQSTRRQCQLANGVGCHLDDTDVAVRQEIAEVVGEAYVSSTDVTNVNINQWYCMNRRKVISIQEMMMGTALQQIWWYGLCGWWRNWILKYNLGMFLYRKLYLSFT